MDLSISSADRGDVTVVHVAGEIDVYTAPVLRERLDEQIAGGRRHLVVDLQGVTFMDSTGLGVLVGRLKLVRVQDGTLKLVCTSERILKVFAITGLDKVFQIYRQHRRGAGSHRLSRARASEPALRACSPCPFSSPALRLLFRVRLADHGAAATGPP